MRRVTEPPDPQFEGGGCSATGPVLVHFRTSWCGQCRMLDPPLHTLAGELEGELRIVDVNLDESPELAGQFGITQVPTLILFNNGTPIEIFIGLVSPEELRSRLHGLLADYSTLFRQ